MKIYHENDASIEALKGKTIAIIGYGNQGRPQALCLRDSGLKVIIGSRDEEKAYADAKEDNMEIMPIADAAKKADLIQILLPDQYQGEVYAKEIAPYVTKGKILCCSHGFSIVFKQIVPPNDVDVIMVAPKSPGSEERKEYERGFGVPGLIAVYQNPSGKARDYALAYAKGMGYTRAGVIECTFPQETYSDLFGEQTVLCGGVVELMKAGFNTLVDAGYPPEIAYFECVNELKLIVDLVYEGGAELMHQRVSDTAEWGSRVIGPKIIGEPVKAAMKEALKNIESGKFANEWIAECKNGMPNMKRMREEAKKQNIEVTGAAIRALFEKKK
jgi:ketol-acid reductoisomerase